MLTNIQARAIIKLGQAIKSFDLGVNHSPHNTLDKNVEVLTFMQGVL